MMHFQTVQDYNSLGASAAAFVLDALRQKPDLLLCAATGHSPTSCYAALAAAYKHEPALFSRLRVIKLDEWYGLPMDHPATCEHYLQQHLLRPLHLSSDRYISLRSDAPDPEAECSRVQQALAEAGPIDICVLGLGKNGHLALNEPADFLAPHVYVATLDRQSREHAMLKGSGITPERGLTLGMADILSSAAIVLLVAGAGKAPHLEALRTARISTQLPASFLWLNSNVTVFSDSLLVRSFGDDVFHVMSQME